jgi:hypothetical protein
VCDGHAIKKGERISPVAFNISSSAVPVVEKIICPLSTFGGI